ncbi:hypothetical protein [Nocardia spumae]|uniref:hypothetical protein n=1 Tax=Nocardia spumae TaxID=2887190 RepID=UPI001D13AFE0|nr:hypothetical protein [Nocardia spumae]
MEKFSAQHTSVQWNRAALARCAELSGGAAAVHTCSAMRDSIDAAVRSGELGVSTREVDVRTRGRTLARTTPAPEAGR